jgi:glycosyltransferase involved in cell wall biosynthesis
MRVGLVYRNFNLGGSLERNSVLLARSLAARGVEVHCYCNPRTRTLDVPGATFHDVVPVTESRARLGYPAELASFALAATRALRRNRDRYDVVDVRGIAAWEHDVVRVHSVAKAVLRRWPAEGGRVYRAARPRAAVAPLTRPEVAVRRAVERLQFRPGRFSRVIAATEQVRDDVVRIHGVAPELVDVIPPPIDMERFANGAPSDVRASLGIASDAPVLLFVGHAFGRKGLDDAIGALPALAPDVHLVVLGNGNPERYREQAARLGVERRVHFVGRTEEPARYYRDSDVFVLPTRQERWGIPLIEAMAAGRPIVTTAAAGAASEVERNGAGVILPEASPETLADAISALLNDPARRREMGERGREAASRFGADVQADAVLAIYERVVAEREAQRGSS